MSIWVIERRTRNHAHGAWEFFGMLRAWAKDAAAAHVLNLNQNAKRYEYRIVEYRRIEP